VWYLVSGAAARCQAAGEGTYAALAARLGELDRAVAAQIEGDLHRTFPTHPVLDCPAGLAALHRVLGALALRDPEVGYVQGINFVAGLHLVVQASRPASGPMAGGAAAQQQQPRAGGRAAGAGAAGEPERGGRGGGGGGLGLGAAPSSALAGLDAGAEERVFWILVCAIEDFMYRGCFAHDLNGCHVEQRVLMALIHRKLPRVARRMDALECNIILFTTEWFLCLYSRSLPPETVARIWDSFLLEGSKILFRVALALFKTIEKPLVESRSMSDMLTLTKEVARDCHDRQRLMQLAFTGLGSMPMARITKLREKMQKEVDIDLYQYRRR